jgi:hypothetical protein
MRKAQLARIAACAAVALGMGLGFKHQEARAEDLNTVWLWKDALGKCPTVCDGSLYACPCRTVEIEH